MRIGIKYCGGCNPRYDRVAAVKELQQRHPEWKIEPAGEGGQEYILVTAGAPGDHSTTPLHVQDAVTVYTRLSDACGG